MRRGAQLAVGGGNRVFVVWNGSDQAVKSASGAWPMLFTRLNDDGSAFEPLITGFLVNNNYIGRPADVEVMKDGSLLVSDDFNGAIYRVTYGVPPVSTR